METDSGYWQMEMNSKDWAKQLSPQDLASGHLKQYSYVVKDTNGLWWAAMLKLKLKKYFFSSPNRQFTLLSIASVG